MIEGAEIVEDFAGESFGLTDGVWVMQDQGFVRVTCDRADEFFFIARNLIPITMKMKGNSATERMRDFHKFKK